MIDPPAACPFCRTSAPRDGRGRCTECGAPRPAAPPLDALATANLSVEAYRLASDGWGPTVSVVELRHAYG